MKLGLFHVKFFPSCTLQKVWLMFIVTILIDPGRWHEVFREQTLSESEIGELYSLIVPIK